MRLYQQIAVSTQANVGTPGPLPLALRGLSDATLANLSVALNPQAVAQLGLADLGYIPVDMPDVPPSVTRLQFIMALKNANKYAAVASAIGGLAVTDPTRIYFLEARDFLRADPRLATFATAMGQSPAQVDALFTAAALIPA